MAVVSWGDEEKTRRRNNKLGFIALASQARKEAGGGDRQTGRKISGQAVTETQVESNREANRQTRTQTSRNRNKQKEGQDIRSDRQSEIESNKKEQANGQTDKQE